MTNGAFLTLKQTAKRQLDKACSSAGNVTNDIAQGFFEITHNSFAMLGLGLVFVIITLTARPDLRQAGEAQLIAWLQERQEIAIGYTEPDAIDRATAAEP